MANATIAESYIRSRLVCEPRKPLNSKGFLGGGDNLFIYTTPVLLLQLVLIFFLTRIISCLTKPLRQSMIVAPIIVGMLLGPSLRQKTPLSFLFPKSSRLILRTLAEFGFMIHLFVLGVQVDMRLLKNTGKKAMLIGVLGNLVSYVCSYTTHKLVHGYLHGENERGTKFLITSNSITFFVTTNSLLSELKILNSELGHLASSASMISEIWGELFVNVISNIVAAAKLSSWKPIWNTLSTIGFYLSLYFIFRPIVIRMANRTLVGKSIKENHIMVILIIVLGTGLCGVTIGQQASFSCFMFGLFLPAGPPLGTLLVQRLDTFASGLLLPVYFTVFGYRVDFPALPKHMQSLIAESILFAGYIGKFIGSIASSFCFGVPFYDASLLALIMCYKGIKEIGILNRLADNKVVENTVYILSVMNILITAGIIVPIVSYYYDPLRRKMLYQKRTIQHSKREIELGILVCIHGEENVPPAINLVEASNPTRASPISLNVLQLIELTGRASAILVPHSKRDLLATHEATCSEPIVNAFNNFEHLKQGRVTLQHYTAVAPYISMHNDICNLAMDKKVSMLILPFHKQFAFDRMVNEDSSPHIRALNINVINTAPCSVGVLIDRTPIGATPPLFIHESSYCIAMLFIGGADDEEALAYSRRMADHPKISLTVVWFKPNDQERWHEGKKNTNIALIMDEFRATSVGNKRIGYKEVTVEDGLQTTEIIRSMQNDFQLCIVGKHHKPDSPVTLGIDTEWSECSELGIIGDMLVTSDFPFSVLVVQQPLVDGFDPDNGCPKESVALIKGKTQEI